ncbi:hypothetical protein D3C75_591480 [compost metagenome]
MLNQHRLARPVTVIHGPDLRQRNMRLVDDNQHVIREVIHQRVRSSPGLPEGQRSGIVLDPRTEADLLHHLDIIACPLLQALCLEQLACITQNGQPLLKLTFNIDYCDSHGLFLGNKVRGRKNRNMIALADQLSGQHINFCNPLNLITEQFNPDGVLPLGGREDFDHITAYTEGTPHKVKIIALILDIHQPAQNLIARLLHSDT